MLRENNFANPQPPTGVSRLVTLTPRMTRGDTSPDNKPRVDGIDLMTGGVVGALGVGCAGWQHLCRTAADDGQDAVSRVTEAEPGRNWRRPELLPCPRMDFGQAPGRRRN